MKYLYIALVSPLILLGMVSRIVVAAFFLGWNLAFVISLAIHGDD